MNILIADDEHILQQTLRFQLEQWGHTVIAAENGRQAWDLLQSHDCHLVVTDWDMPEMTGLELIRQIRQSQRSSYVYVILLTSKSEQDSLIAGLRTGADDYLTKPVHGDELQARLQSGQRIIEMERRLAQQNRELSGANAKMKRDLGAAAKIQQAFLPGRQCDVPGAQFAWLYSPCTELAGDMLNVERLDDDHVSVYLLDVSGHGVQAALMAVSACRYLSNQHDASSVLWERRNGTPTFRPRSPAAAAEQLNRHLVSEWQTEQFLTLAFGILNHRTGEFRYTIAGHPPLIHVTANGGARFLTGDGLPIGITETNYEEHSIHLDPGDRLIFYSDGLTECMSSSEELFGNSRLLQMLAANADQSLDVALSNILNQLQDWCADTPAHDDISVLAFEFNSPRTNRTLTTQTHFQPAPRIAEQLQA